MQSHISLKPKSLILALTVLIGVGAAVAGGDKPDHPAKAEKWPTPAFKHLSSPPRRGPGQKVPAPAPVRAHEKLRDQHWIELNIAPDISYWAVREHLDDLGNGDFVWSGRVKDEAVSRVTLSVREGVAVGTIVIPRAEGVEGYVIEPTPSGDSWLLAADGGGAGDGSPIEPPPLPVGDGEPPATAAYPAVVDVMVLYTQATRQRWGASGIEAKINEAISYSNLGYQNSGVYVTLNLVYTAEVNYTETGHQSDAIDAMRNPWDSKLDEVPWLRDQCAADLVTLISEDNDACGLSYVMTVVSTAFADYAFNVVWSTCLNSTALTYPHELGHLFGCQHDRANASFEGAFPYSYGYRRCPPEITTFRTIMSYDCGGVTRINYYSTPDISLGGHPIGVSHTDPVNAAENVLSINNTAHTVENFRIPPPAPPAAPTGLSASATAYNSVTLCWTDNANDETSYKVERSPNGSNPWSQVASVPADTVAYVDPTVSGSTTYYYRVRAMNAGGYSAYSNVANVTTPAGPPSAPSNLTATAASNTQINLAWTDTSNVETEYRVERSLNGTQFNQIAVLPANSSSYSNTGLTGSTTYYYRVRAANSAGTSGYSNTASATTNPDPVLPPAAPAIVSAVPLTYSQIQLCWSDNSTIENGFKIERSPNGSNGWVQIATVGANVTCYTDTGLSPSTTHYYRVRAYNTGGDSAYSNILSATTPANVIPAPSALTAAAASNSQINLAWTDNASNETGFEIERSANGSTGWTLVGTVGANVTAFANTGLTAVTTYYYRVRAINAGGASGYSNTATATTQPAIVAPSGLTATAISSGQITLSWTDNAATETWQEIERSTDGNSWTLIDSVVANVTAYTDAGLNELSLYYYRVRARNSAATSLYSNPASATTPTQPPVADPLPSVSGEDGYVLESGENTGLGGSISAGKGYVGDSRRNYQYKSIFSFNTAGIPDNATILSATLRLNVASITGTSPFTTHGACRVDLKAGTGFGGATALAKPDFQAEADAVGVATLCSAAAGQWSEGALSGGALVLINKTGKTQVRVYFATDDNNDAGDDYINFNTAAASNASLRPQLVVQYLADPVLPAAPSGLTAEPASVTQITLTWSDNANNESGFLLERSADNLTWLTVATRAANTTSYTDSDLTTGATYYYRLLAYNDAGYSAYTAVASAVPQTPPTAVTFNSVGTEDGYVLESGENTNVGGSIKTGSAYLGDSSKDYQYKCVFSFDTSSLPDNAQIVSAKLRLLRTGGSGTNPFDTHGTCSVDIKGGAGFGDAAALAAGDFQAAADATDVGALSNAAATGAWSEATLGAEALTFINKGTGRTQVRVAFQLDDNDDGGNDYLIYATGSNSTAAKRPQLIIKYMLP